MAMDEIRTLLDLAKVKPAITRYINRLKSERNYPDVIFKLRNAIQTRTKFKSLRAFKTYDPPEDYVQVKMFRHITEIKGRVNSARHGWAAGILASGGTDPLFVGYEGEIYASSNRGEAKDIIVPRWFIDNLKTKRIAINRVGTISDEQIGEGDFVAGVQTHNDPDSFLDNLQNVCRQSDEIAAMETAMSRSGELTDFLIQIVSKKPMPDMRQKIRPPYLRPLAAGRDRKLTHDCFANLIEKQFEDNPEEMFFTPVYDHLNACVPNAIMNCFKNNDSKRVNNLKRPASAKPPITYKTIWKSIFPKEPYPGDDKWPPITLKDAEKACSYWSLQAVAYDIYKNEIWRYTPTTIARKNKIKLCLIVKDNHAFQVSDRFVKMWLTRKTEDVQEMTPTAKSSFLASYYLNEDPPRVFAGRVKTLIQFYRLAANHATNPASKETHILWGGENDLTLVAEEMLRDYPNMPEPLIQKGSNYRISRLEIKLNNKLVHLHEAPFDADNHSVADINAAVAFKHGLIRCLVPENRNNYGPGVKEAFTEHRNAPPHEAFQEYDPTEPHVVLDHIKFYPSILKDLEYLPKFGLFDRVQPYDGHTPEDLSCYGGWLKKTNVPLDLKVMFPSDQFFDYGLTLKPYLEYIHIDTYLKPMKLVPNPFREILKSVFESVLPTDLKKKAVLYAIGELGKMRNVNTQYSLCRTLEEALYAKAYYGNGVVLPSPSQYFTLKRKSVQDLKDGYLPWQHLIYGVARMRLAKLMRRVGVQNVVAVNNDCVFLKQGVSHPFTDVIDDTDYENLGKVREESKMKLVRAKVKPRGEKRPVVARVVQKPTIYTRIGQERIDGIFDEILNLENCVNINDASLKAIAMNCTRLRSLCTDGCDKLSSDVLRCSKFKSASELRIVLLSISNVPA
jgi:hypothetical protein